MHSRWRQIGATLVTLGWALAPAGCGGDLHEGIPSDINPNKPPAQVKSMIKLADEAGKASAALARSKAKGKDKGPAKSEAPDQATIPGKPTKEAD
jgi:hypothetical protein